MRKITLQLILILCVISESFLIFKMMTATNIIYQELYVGLIILVLLFMIRLINSLTDITYGNHEEN
jgi:hypothetical protein